MTRPFGVKGKKRKHSQSKQYSEEEHQQPPPKKAVAEESKEPSPEPSPEPEPERESEPAPTEEDELSGIPIVPSEKNSTKPNVIFILEKASLEVAKVGKVLLHTLLFLTLLFFFTFTLTQLFSLFLWHCRHINF